MCSVSPLCSRWCFSCSDTVHRRVFSSIVAHLLFLVFLPGPMDLCACWCCAVQRLDNVGECSPLPVLFSFGNFLTFCTFKFLYINFIYLYFIYLFLQRGGGDRERNISVWLPLRRPSYWGPGPQPRHVLWLGIELATLWFTVRCSIHWATPARAYINFRISFYISQNWSCRHFGRGRDGVGRGGW